MLQMMQKKVVEEQRMRRRRMSGNPTEIGVSYP